MTLRMPGVPYLGPPDANYGGRVVRPPMGMVVHIAEGSYQGTINWQKNPTADVSSYFVTSRAGEIAQMLDLDLMAWTQADGNSEWIGVENEGFHTEAFTDAQVDANAAIFAWLRSVWPSIPAQVTNSPSVGGLGWHGMGGVAWGNHPNCPGASNVALLPIILAHAIGTEPPASSPRRDQDMFRLIDPDGGQSVISPDTLSPTGWSWSEIVDPISPLGWMVAAGVGTVNGNPKDPNHDPHSDNGWRPGTFGPSKVDVREQLIADIAAAVIAKLPPAQGGSAPTLPEITAAVRAELNATGLGPR